jgi:hypothetical protein
VSPRLAAVSAALLLGCATTPPPRAACAEVAPAGTVVRPRSIAPSLPTLRVENLRFHDLAVCASGECRVEGASAFAPARPATEDGATTVPPAMAWVHVVHPGAALVLPRRAATDLLGVALVGEISLERPAAPQVAPVRAGPWTAFLVPDGDAVLRAVGGAPAAALLVTATGDAPVTGRGGDVVLRDLVALDDLSWAGGAVHARIAFEAPLSPRASLGVLIASDDAPVAEHAHPGAWEVLAAFSAAGRLHIPAQTVGDVTLTARDRSVTGGSIAYVPASVRHAWVPDGTHPLIAVQVYAPAGPEQRFRGLAGR